LSKIHLDRLENKYGSISGRSYEELVSAIIQSNTENVQRNYDRRARKQWEKIGDTVTTKEKRLVLPEPNESIPQRAISVRKAAEKGKMITDSLRDKLTKDLRESIFNFPETKYIVPTGSKAGRINPKLISEFESKVKDTFAKYTKRSKGQMPSNIHTIAVTETRGAISQVKAQYMDSVSKNNPDIVVRKVWIHNSSLSKEPRRGHVAMDGKTVGKDEFFSVPIYHENKRKVGSVLMSHPHDPGAPSSEIIGCNCDYDILVRKRRKNE